MSAVAFHIEDAGMATAPISHTQSNCTMPLTAGIAGCHSLIMHVAQHFSAVFNAKSTCSKPASAKLYPAEIVMRLYPAAGKLPM